MTDRQKTAAIDLQEPVSRGDTAYAKLQLRRPTSGELRGLSLVDVTMCKTDAIVELLPRIGQLDGKDPIAKDEAQALDPADLFAAAVEIAGFFMPATTKPTIQ